MAFFSRFIPWFCYFLILAILPVCGETQHPTASASPNKLKITIISNKNGVGLSLDIDILQTELAKLGHEVRFHEDKELQPLEKSDVNIYVQPHPNALYFLSFAPKNILIPNPEWCYYSPSDLNKFDMILCKTKEAERIFKPLNANTFYLGFTCKDRYDASHAKNYKSPLHLAGASIQKGTDSLAKVWLQNPQWPELVVIKHKNYSYYPEAKNIKMITEYLPHDKLTALLNTSGIHICPSESEGFGHYIVEGMSCGAVVLTTDAPPMNEFINDKRALITYDRSSPFQLATAYYVDKKQLDRTLTHLLLLPEKDLVEMGRNNREAYLERDRQFKERVAVIFTRDFIFNSDKQATN